LALPAGKAGFSNFIYPHYGKVTDNIPEELVIVSSDMVLSKSAWKKLRSWELPPETIAIFKDTGSFALVRSRNTGMVIDALNLNSYKEMVDSLNISEISLDENEWRELKSAEDAGNVEAWLLQGLIKDTEGFMSRHFERKISLFVTGFLVETSMTPNAMTILSSLIGIAGAFFFIPAQKWYDVAGALLFWLHSVLDGCDGEIARLKFMESKYGGLLDFWGDNVVHSFVFACMAYGMYRTGGFFPAGILGISAVCGTVLTAGVVYWKTMRGKEASGPVFTSVTAKPPDSSPQAMEKVADYLARRDFIYLVIILAFLGKVQIFLWLGAIGAPVYLLVVLWLHIRD